MSATKAQINWTSVNFASTAITRVTNASVGQGGQLIKFKGDADQFPTIIAMVDQEPHASITTADVGTMMGFTPGTQGTLTATLNDAKLASGCAADSAQSELSAMLRGTVFEGAHKGLPGAAVRITWRGTFKNAGGSSLAFRNEQRDLKADAAGNWYLCGVPRERVVTVRATVGGRSSAPVTVRIPRERVSAGVDVEVPPL